jgi:hypothetical protein
MSDPTLPQHPAPPTFALFKEALASVAETRVQSRVLALLAESGGNADLGDAPSDADVVAWCFARLARDLDAVVQVDVGAPVHG